MVLGMLGMYAAAWMTVVLMQSVLHAVCAAVCVTVVLDRCVGSDGG